MSIKIYVKYVKNNRDFHTTKLNLPTGNLDKENRRKIVELLQQIAHEQDRCVIVVTHSDYVKKKCDICYEMGDDDEE